MLKLKMRQTFECKESFDWPGDGKPRRSFDWYLGNTYYTSAVGGLPLVRIWSPHTHFSFGAAKGRTIKQTFGYAKRRLRLFHDDHRFECEYLEYS
jgi:hypothetical protein